MIEAVLSAALEAAPTRRTLSQLARDTNKALGLDWSDAKWRGVWKNHPAEAFLIKKKLGEALNQHQHGQKLHLNGALRGAIVSDVHAPYHDPRAIELAAQILAWWKPDVLVHNGDNVDFPGLSKFDQNPARKFRAQDEVDVWQTQVAIPFNQAVGRRCRKIVLPGNHDLRLLKLLWANPELFSVRSLHLPALLEVEKLGMEYVGHAVMFNGSLEASHGTRVSAQSGYSARAELAQRGYAHSTATGHVHRAGRHEFTLPNGTLVVGQEVPCLCDLNPEYLINPNWAQGLVLLESDATRTSLWPVVFGDDYTCNIVGKKFSA